MARGVLRPECFLAIDPGSTRIPVNGEATKDPAFGLPAKWIVDNDRQRAELGGYTVVDAPNVLVTHLGEVVRRHAHELLSREDLKSLVDKARESAPSVVDELVPNVLTMGALHRVLTLLLEERVPISNLTRILESLANHAPQVKEPIELSERVRVDLGRAICDRFRDERGRIHALVLDPRLRTGIAAGRSREKPDPGPGATGETDYSAGQRVAQGDGQGTGRGFAVRRQPAASASAIGGPIVAGPVRGGVSRGSWRLDVGAGGPDQAGRAGLTFILSSSLRSEPGA